MKNFFMTLMLCYLAINCKDCNTSFTLLNDIDAVDLSSNGPNTFFCTTTKQIVQMNYSGKILNNQIIAKKATEKCKSDTLPDCNRIEANYNGNFFVIDFSGNMFYIKVIAPETYAIECVEHSEKFVDVGCNINGICFAADEKNTLFRVNLINEVPVLEKYFTLSDKALSLDVGGDNDGNLIVPVVLNSNNLLVYKFTYDQIFTTSDKNTLSESFYEIDVYACDVSVGADNRIYISTCYYGSFVFNELSLEGIGTDVNRITSLGKRISAGYDLWVVSKNQRVLKNPLFPRKDC